MTTKRPSPVLSSVQLPKLIRDALRGLRALGFSVPLIHQHRRAWSALLAFARRRSFPLLFSAALVAAFLRNRRFRSSTKSRRSERRHELKTRLRRLEEFAQEGRFRFRRLGKRRAPLPPQFGRLLEKYLRFLLEHRGVRETSLRHRAHNLRQFLLFLDGRGVRSLSSLRLRVFSDYLITKSHFQPSTLAGVSSDLRGFLKYLFLRQVLPKDLSPHVPRIRLWRQDRLPAIWKPEQIEAMLAAIDRTSPLGKRNFAIVLLACRLGLRTCDIRTFKLEDIRWDEAKIAVRQSKTGVPLVLPLSEEVGQALIDYLKHGRPRSQHREVFLSINAPFAPFGHSYNFHNIITDCRRLAGLRVPREGHWGMHSFRHTLATRLLECGTPLPVISDILGHRSIDSTQVYTKVDLASLRGAALDLEELPHA